MLRSFLFSASLVCLSQISAIGAEIYKPSAVVELFTSQGCHSCPPADKLIGKFAKGKDVLGLGWHVDYWDYLGWQDTFASTANTQRQYSYAKALGERQVYTPQAIINGRTHEVGSKANRVVGAINHHQETGQGLQVQINAMIDADSLKIQIDSGDFTPNITLFIVYFDQEASVEITRGENTGKTITYHNIVRKIQPIGMLKRTGFDMDFPMTEIRKEGTDSAALILQKTDKQGNPLPIIGALVLSEL